MRIKLLCNPKIYDDTDEKHALFVLDSDLIESVIDGMLRQASGRVNIALSATENLPLGDVATVRGVYIRAAGDFNVILNGGTDILQVRRPDTATGRNAHFLFEGIITQVNITNASATAALDGLYCVWGEPQAT